jgi:putative Holliday junction resolvase
MKVLAVDYGRKRVGLAVGDTLTRVAAPLPLIAGGERRDVVAEIARRAGEYEAERIVVGLPLNMDGSRGPACAEVERFAAALRRACHLPVELVDETLSSVEAEALAREMQPDFRKRKAFLDSVAAQVILRAYLERP